MARPPVVAIDHDKATYTGAACCGQRPLQWGGLLHSRAAGCSSATARGGTRPRLGRRGYCQLPVEGRPRPARKGRPTVGAVPAGRQPVGKGIAHKGYRLQGPSLAGTATNRGSACKGGPHGGATRGSGAGRRGGRPLAGRLPTGKGSRRLHRGGDGGTVRAREEG
ncbi:hypothetical protein BHE74_00019975 [Ensete ventricosum]|nr:hypothetical protein BHE74_00019975 [Ensete ventricosum]